MRLRRPARARPEALPEMPPPGLGHNGGPPLEHVPEWGPVGIGNYFSWKAACETAFAKVPAETAIRRARKAEQLGLTYREYQLEILERGRFLQHTDTARIAEIKARRPDTERIVSGPGVTI